MFDPASSKTTGYHLFLEPNGLVVEEVSELIQTLADEYGGPVFTPHVTLLAAIPAEDEKAIIERTSAFVKQLSPFALTLGQPEIENAYFRALYIQIKEQEAMTALHHLASKIFLMEANQSYKAHLSLLYGNYPEKRKMDTISSLELPSTKRFEAKSIHLYRTEGEVTDWHHMQEFKFEGD